MRRIVLALAFLSTPALAQQQPFYPISDRDIWEAMSRALAEIPASLAAHQQMQRILQDAQREAQMREARKSVNSNK